LSFEFVVLKSFGGKLLRKTVLSMLTRTLILVLCVCFCAFSSNKEGLDFLAANKLKEGVMELPSGLQYKVLKKGSGMWSPLADSPCDCHYSGTLLDGTEFDSSYARGQPTTFAPNQVIKGWTEAMQLMVEGDKWEMYIPSELAYGQRGSPPKIPPDSVLIFQMEIIKIKGGKRPAITCDPISKTDCNDKEIAFIEKYAALPTDQLTTELERLTTLQKNAMSASSQEWLQRRLFILKKMKAGKVDL